jgi:hypothetical protein
MINVYILYFDIVGGIFIILLVEKSKYFNLVSLSNEFSSYFILLLLIIKEFKLFNLKILEFNEVRLFIEISKYYNFCRFPISSAIFYILL